VPDDEKPKQRSPAGQRLTLLIPKDEETRERVFIDKIAGLLAVPRQELMDHLTPRAISAPKPLAQPVVVPVEADSTVREDACWSPVASFEVPLRRWGGSPSTSPTHSPTSRQPTAQSGQRQEDARAALALASAQRPRRGSSGAVDRTPPSKDVDYVPSSPGINSPTPVASRSATASQGLGSRRRAVDRVGFTAAVSSDEAVPATVARSRSRSSRGAVSHRSSTSRTGRPSPRYSEAEKQQAQMMLSPGISPTMWPSNDQV